MLARDAWRQMQHPAAEAACEPDALDEAEEWAAMPDADFLRQLRAEVEGVRAGIVPAGRENVHQV